MGHDAGGPTAVNFALKHPDRTAAVTLMNAFYGDAPGLRVPELIELFSERSIGISWQARRNTARLIEFRRSDVPLLLIWGKADPYLHVTVADYMRSQARNAALHVLDAGHWPQIDAAAEVARIMLARH